MPKRDFDLDFEFDTNSWGELDFASEGEMKEGEEKAREEVEQGVRVVEDVKAQREISQLGKRGEGRLQKKDGKIDTVR